MATLLHRQGDLEAARPPMRHVLAMRRELSGQRAPETLAALAALAMLEKDCGEYGDARDLLQEAAEGASAALGADHPKTKSHQRWLARVEKLCEGGGVDVR